MNEIISYAATVLLLLITLFIYVFLVACIYPLILRSSKHMDKDPKDRGIKKYTYPNGRAIVYETHASLRPYITQYILSDIDGIKYIQCKLSDTVTSLTYDVIAYNAVGRIISCVEISELPLQTTGATKMAPLPRQTAYVNLVVRDVNGQILAQPPLNRAALIRIAVFSALTVITTIIESFLFKSYLLHFSDWWFSYTDVVGSRETLFTWMTAILIGILCAAITLRTYYPGKIKIKKQKNAAGNLQFSIRYVLH